MAQRHFAANHHLRLKIIQGGDNVNPVALVVNGSATFGDASADAVLLANEKGANLVILGVVSAINPTVFVTKRESHIQTPNDFVGHRVGILEGTNTEYVYRSLMNVNHVKRSSVKEVSVSFDIRPFIASKQYDVRPAYIYDEPVTLEIQHVDYNIIRPSDWGVHYVGTVYFAKRSYVASHPDVVRNFVYAMADSWRAVQLHPDVAIDDLHGYDPTLDSAREAIALNRALPFVKGVHDKVLWVEEGDLTDMVESLKSLGVLPSDFNTRSSLDLQFIHDYYTHAEP